MTRVTGLILLGVTLRLAFTSIPNFAPVAGLALFAGYLLSDRRWALLVPLAIMGLTDVILGGYQFVLMATVYTALSLPALAGLAARRRWAISGTEPGRAAGSVFCLTGYGMAASLFFFFASNLATWWVTPIYEKTAGGLWLCMLRGAEFFRYTLAGDLCTTFVLFGCLAVVRVAVVTWQTTDNRRGDKPTTDKQAADIAASAGR